MFEWDPAKAASNLQKHGVRFADAESVLEDEWALTVEDYSSEEERFFTIGMDQFGRVLVVVYSWRGERIRLISVRRAEPHEIQVYEGPR